jgi:hypothetical protein
MAAAIISNFAGAYAYEAAQQLIDDLYKIPNL